MSTDVTSPARPASRTGTVRISLGLLAGTMSYILPFSAASGVLLPARITDLDTGHKVTLLAVLSGVAAVAALIANVVFGALSDRTRTRFGARTPWILGGAVVTALLMIPVSRAGDFASLLGWWCLACAAINATTAAVAAIVPDRVPAHRRATVSAVIGVALLLATAIGTVIGSLFLHDTTRGLLTVAGLFVVLATASVLAAPEHPNTGPGNVRSGLTGSLRLPSGAPDFYWALAGRLLLVLGYFMINSFQLYIFTDYVHLGTDAAARALTANSVLFLGTALLAAAVTGPLSDRTRRRKPVVMGAALLSASAIVIPLLLPTVAGMAVFAAVGGVAFGAYYAVDAALMTEVLPDHTAHARDLGVLNIATTGGQALAPAASSLLVGLGAGYVPVFIGATLACLLGAACVPPIRSVR